MAEIANLVVKYSADTKDAEAGADRVNSSIGKVTKAGAALAVAGGALLGGFFAKSIMAGANFESSMDGVAASLGGVDVAGGITTDQLSHLADVALDIGANTTVGANDAATAMDLLAKGGVTYQQIMDGAALSAVQVSTATATGLDQTAQSMAAFTALFRDANEQMGVSFSDMSDITVNAMNASGMSMSEFQTGMTNMAPLIANTGLGFQDAAGLISYFNNQGMAAARVGTSLTAAYTNLTAPTNEMLQAQQALGIQVYDNNGVFRGIPAILGDVQEATQGMSEADRDAAINALFGADARDVVGLALKDNTGALDEWIKGMGQSGTAEAAMATRMDNLKGDVENLKGAFETLTIRIGSAFQPALRGIVQGLTGGIVAITAFSQSVIALMNNGLNPVAAIFTALQKVFADIGGENTPGAIAAIARGFRDLSVFATRMGEALGDVMDAFQALREGNFREVFFELRDAATTALDAISDLGTIAINWVLDTAAPTVIGWVATYATDVWNGIKIAAGWTWDNRAELGNITLAGAVSLGNELIGSLSAAIDSLASTATRLFQSHKASLQTALETLFDFDIGANFGNNLGARFGEWLNGLDWGGLFGQGLNLQTKLMQGIGAAALGAITLLGGFTGQMASAIGGFLTGMIGAINWGGIQSAIGDKFGQVFQAASDKVQEAVQKISDYLGAQLSRAADGVSSALGPAKTAIDDISTAAGNAVTLVKNLITEGFDTLKGVGDDVSGYLSPITTVLGDIEDKINAIIGAWNNLPFVGNGGGSGGRAGNEIAAPGSGYVSPPSAGGPVTNGVPITTLPNVGSGTTAIFNQVKQIASQVAAAMTQLANSVRTGVQQATAALNPLGTAFAATGARITAATTQMATQVRAQFTAMQAALTAQTTAMTTAVRTQFTTMQTAVAAAMTAMVAQVNAQFSQMNAQATAQVNALRAAVQSGMSAMAAAGSAAMNQFASAVRSGFSQAAAAAQSGVAAIRGAVNSIGSLYGQGFSIGSSFGQGVAAGLYSMLGAVQAAAAAIVAAAAQAAAAKAQIASPSKLMRDQIGVPLAQGVIVGLDSQRSNVASAFASMIPVDANLGRGYRGSGSSPYAARSSAGGPVVQNVTIITLEPGKWQEYLKKADRGDRAYQQQQPRARDRQLGSTR